MSKIREVDLLLIDQVFVGEKGPGYVLRFTDATFADFFQSEAGVNINNQKYCVRGTSKGKRLRAFLQIEPDALAARALRGLWEYRQAMSGTVKKVPDDVAESQDERFSALVHAMDGKGGVSTPTLRKSPSNFVSPPPQAIAALNGQFQSVMSMAPQN